MEIGFTKRTRARAALGFMLLVGLFIISRYNYLLFHSLAEFFSIAIAYASFMFAWNSRKYTRNKLFLFFGIAYLFVGSLDMLHALSYKGMGIFGESGPNLPTQLWIAARYMESLALLTGLWLMRRSLHEKTVLTVFSVVFVIVLMAIFRYGIFPKCFEEGVGLTPFKIASEYVISVILLIAIALLRRRREEFEPVVYRLIGASIILTIMAEMSFTLYSDVFGLSNLSGHYLKLISFYLIYVSVIETGLTSPYSLLFRELKESEEKYHTLFSNMTDGFALHKVILDNQGTPADYVFIEVNEAFETLTGLRGEDILGKRVTEVLPGIEKDPADWIGRYGNVALGKGETRFEQYAENLGKWYWVSAYSPEKGFFATIFEDITDRKRMENSLRLALDEKEMLIKETNHRVKNNLIVIQSLLKLQSQEIEDKEAREKFEESQQRVKAMSMLHERLYRSRDLKHVDAGEYLESLVNSMAYGYTRGDSAIRIITDIKDVPLDISTMIPCGLIVNELVSNALKHAFPDRKGVLSISLSGSSEEGYTLSVRDSGNGLPQGFDIDKAETLGLQIITSLTKQLGGKLEILNKGGTEFRVFFREEVDNVPAISA